MNIEYRAACCGRQRCVIEIKIVYCCEGNPPSLYIKQSSIEAEPKRTRRCRSSARNVSVAYYTTAA